MIVPTATKTNLGAGHNAEPVIEILSDGLPGRTNIPAKVPFCDDGLTTKSWKNLKDGKACGRDGLCWPQSIRLTSSGCAADCAPQPLCARRDPTHISPGDRT
jgi:hypothetical protein